MRVHRFVGIAGALAVALLAPAAADAASYKPSVSVVASGLDNPRGVSVGYGGALVVAEAGKGGSGPCIESPEGGSVCLGASGAITSVSADRRGRWSQRRIVSGLPSLATASGTEATGPHHVSPYGEGDYVATLGLGGNPQARASLGRGGQLLGWTVVVDPHTRRPAVRRLADLTAYEARRDPDKQGVDSNPYGVLGTRRGAVATDAGGNTLLDIDRRGRVSTLAVFPDRLVPAPPPPVGPGGEVPMQAVPTSVVRGPDGAYYVSQLTGFPFPVGGANVYRVVPGRGPTVFARGFTNIIDLAFDRQGRLLVLEIAKNGLLSGDQTGALIRVDKRGRHTEIVPGRLTAPGGIAIGGDGAYYVTNRSVVAGAGELLRIRA